MFSPEAAPCVDPRLLACVADAAFGYRDLSDGNPYGNILHLHVDGDEGQVTPLRATQPLGRIDGVTPVSDNHGVRRREHPCFAA